MKEIRFHGRGGQGAVTAAELLAVAAFYDGKYCQAFPFFGVERRGAPVTAFSRIDDRFIRIRSQIYEPDYIVVQDATLLEVIDVADGLKRGGIAIINTEKKPEKIKLKTKADIRTVNATQIALDVLGVPIVNTAMLGAFAAITGEVSLDSLKKATAKRFPEKIAIKNAKAVEVAYGATEGK
jgi:pyruvate ferredoxin oxidoreductase gamma subunit